MYKVTIDQDGERRQLLDVTLINASCDNMGLLLRIRGRNADGARYDEQLLMDDARILIEKEVRKPWTEMSVT